MASQGAGLRQIVIAAGGYLIQIALSGDVVTGAQFETGNGVPTAPSCPLERRLDAFFKGVFAPSPVFSTLEGVVWELPGELSSFTRRVLFEVAQVPFGELVSYKELAQRCGIARGGFQAIGGAVKRNPLLIIIPCHRVIASGHKIGGYGPGIEIKKRLLAAEGHTFRGEKVLS